MRKCPRCGYDIEEHDKYCPHCGYDLGNRHGLPVRRRKFSFLPYLLLMMSFMVIPLLYSYMFEGLVSPLGNPWSSSSKQSALPEKVDVAPTAVLERFDTLIDFEQHYSNVDSIVTKITDYEEFLNQKGNYVFDKDYIILVYDNYDVAVQLTYQTDIQEKYNLKIVKTYTRDQSVDDEDITFVKKDLKTFEELLFTDQEKEIAHIFIDDMDAINSVLHDFSQREDEFEQKKDTLGHYGLGTYHKDISYVVDRYGDTYQVKLTFMK